MALVESFWNRNPHMQGKRWTETWPRNCRVCLVLKHFGAIFCPDVCSCLRLVCGGGGHSRISEFSRISKNSPWSCFSKRKSFFAPIPCWYCKKDPFFRFAANWIEAWGRNLSSTCMCWVPSIRSHYIQLQDQDRKPEQHAAKGARYQGVADELRVSSTLATACLQLANVFGLNVAVFYFSISCWKLERIPENPEIFNRISLLGRLRRQYPF